ncbi:MAG: hypothetical protein ABIZ50_01820 [Solirubrobacterales bacterium]
MDARVTAIVGAGARTAFGIALLAAPKPIAERWIGPRGKEMPAATLARSVGVRDLALGGGGVLALVRRDSSASTWLAAAALCDVGDAVATLLARDSLPAKNVRNTLMLAVGSAILTSFEAARA